MNEKNKPQNSGKKSQAQQKRPGPAADSTNKDVYHDDNRKNQFDPEVAKSLKPGKQDD